MKHFLLAALLSILSLGNIVASEYHNTTTKVTHFDYSQYTVTYTDVNGIEHTVPITDEALTPEHQMALLRKVYKDPSIPGIHYAYDYNGYQTRKIDYNRRGHLGDANGNWLGSKNETYPNPEQDGMTLLLVQVKDSWKTSYHNESNMREYFNKAIESIKLIPDFVRINDPDNPGYLFSIDDVANKFFFISKGKPRASYTKPLFALFEQISPVDAKTGDQPTDTFIDKMKAGHAYFCFHDCSNVFSMTGGHWFTISKSGENYSLNNLSIFIPDRRFEYEQDPNMSDNDTHNSANLYNEYGNSQNVGEEVWELMPQTLIYKVKLTATLDRINVSAPDKFNVVLDWESAYGNMHVPEHYYVYIIDNQGNKTLLTQLENQPTQLTHFEYEVPRYVDPYQLRYMVTGAPIIYEQDNQTIVMGDDSKPLSTITADSQVASITVPGMDPYFTEAVSHKSRYDINNEVNIYKNKISISPTTVNDYRSIKNSTGAFQLLRNDIVVASITFTQNGVGYDYTVTYNASSQNTTMTYDDEQPVTSGTLSGFDDASVMIIDRFVESTMTNSHPSQYSYRIMQDDTGDHSNIYDITIHKTNSNVSCEGYAEADVLQDVDGQLPSKTSVIVEFPGITNPIYNIDRYDIYGNQSIIGKAENTNNDGNYYVMGLGPTEQLNESQGWFTGDIQVVHKTQTSGSYVPVICTLEGDTYGSDIKEVSLPTVAMRTMNLVKTNPFSGAHGLVMAYEVDLRIRPTLTDNITDVYYYRVWRDGVLLNDLSSTSGDGWGSNYSEIQGYYPGNDDIYVDDIFIDEVLDEKKTFTYVVRMYSTDGEQYYVSEKTLNVIFDQNVVTSVEDLDADIASVEYYNLLGVRSDRPFEGLNIVIMRDKQGKIRASKQLF